MTRPARPFRLEILEKRDVPSATNYGTPWLDGEHLTLSLAPDGASISGAANDLSAVLSAAGPNATTSLLRAFQTWAAVTDVNLGITADGGQAFGTAGAIQGDARFGDIRVGARVLSSDVLAITSPFNYFNTYSGNVVLNSAQPLGTTYDLYTVALHEAGHALGLGDNTDLASAMDGSYIGARAGLSTGDVAAIQGLYGARPADAFEGATGNNTIATATAYSGAVTADLGQGDVDYYRFATPLLLPATTVTLQASGLSLLTAHVTVYDSAGRVVASAAATDPLHNDITLNLSNLRSASTYYVRVDGGSAGVFGVGAYNLTIKNSLLSTVTGTVNLLSSELGLNDTLASATKLLPRSLSVGGAVDYLTRASLSAGSDVDYYKIQAPAAPNGGPVVMEATAWSLGGAGLSPRVAVFDAAGNRVVAQILSADGSGTTVQVANAVAGQTYYLKVFSDNGAIGNYALAAAFRGDVVTFPMNATGTLTASAPSTSGQLVVQEGAVMHLVLAVGSVPNDPKSAVTVIVRNADGIVVAQLTAKADDALSLDVFLAVGTYSIQITAAGGNGGAPTSVPFTLSAMEITDPIGAQPTDPTSSPSGGTSPSSTTTSSPSGGTSPSNTTSGSPSSGTNTASSGTTSSGSTTTTSSGGSYWGGTTPSSNTTWY
jgi:hypothetical protein